MAKIIAITFNEELISKIKGALSEPRYHVEAFSSPALAMKKLKMDQDETSIVIIDVGLKKFGGLEFLQYVRELPNGANARIIVMTTKTKCDFHELADGSLIKPFTTLDLVQKVEFMLVS